MFFRFISCFLPSLLFFSVQVHAANSSCISEVQIRNVSLSFKFVPMNLIPQTELCDSQAESYQLASILLSLKDLRLDPAPLSGRYDQKILGDDFWKYLTTRIKVISKADESSPSCRSGAMAYVEPETHNTLF